MKKHEQLFIFKEFKENKKDPPEFKAIGEAQQTPGSAFLLNPNLSSDWTALEGKRILNPTLLLLNVVLKMFHLLWLIQKEVILAQTILSFLSFSIFFKKWDLKQVEISWLPWTPSSLQTSLSSSRVWTTCLLLRRSWRIWSGSMLSWWESLPPSYWSAVNSVVIIRDAAVCVCRHRCGAVTSRGWTLCSRRCPPCRPSGAAASQLAASWRLCAESCMLTTTQWGFVWRPAGMRHSFPRLYFPRTQLMKDGGWWQLKIHLKSDTQRLAVSAERHRF